MTTLYFILFFVYIFGLIANTSRIILYGSISENIVWDLVCEVLIWPIGVGFITFVITVATGKIVSDYIKNTLWAKYVVRAYDRFYCKMRLRFGRNVISWERRELEERLNDTKRG